MHSSEQKHSFMSFKATYIAKYDSLNQLLLKTLYKVIELTVCG